jgi:hypothetical protein
MLPAGAAKVARRQVAQLLCDERRKLPVHFSALANM